MSKVALITGASKGIGAATAIAFAKRGYDVAVNYKSDDKSAKTVAAEVESTGQKCVLVKCDVFSDKEIKAMFEKVIDEFGRIDVLVNNAGSPSEPKFGQYTQQHVLDSINANFGSSVLCTQEAVRYMKSGCVLFTSSIYGLQFGGNPSLALYSASKAAMINFAQTMAENLGPDIRCNVVAPGTTKTPSWDEVAEEYSDVSLSMNIQKEWVGAEEIAHAFVFLAETPHINAQTITIDAGWQKKIRAKSVMRK